MPVLLQNLAVLLIVLACAAVVARQAWRSLSGREGAAGNCCAKGCAAHPTGEAAKPNARIVLLPVEFVGRRRK